jgi:hypothetical protein
VIVTPALEEVIFRGYLQQRLETLLSARQALFVQAVLFAVAHLSVPNLISHLVIGLLLGRLRQVTRCTRSGTCGSRSASSSSSDCAPARERGRRRRYGVFPETTTKNCRSNLTAVARSC